MLKVNEVSLGIEVRGEDLTVALQAEELSLQHLGTVGLWPFLHGQCPGKEGGHSSKLVGFVWGSHSLTGFCHCSSGGCPSQDLSLSLQ